MSILSTPLKIEKMIYGGDGLARASDASGKGTAVFLPFVLPGEEVIAQVTEQRGGFARAHLEEIVIASSRRAVAPCAYYQSCGGCHYQHTEYEHQLGLKAGILRETLLRTAKLDWPGPIATHSADPWNYRNRSRMKVRQTGAEFAIGYYRLGSHQLLPVEKCPISSPLINRTLAAIWEIGRSGGFFKSIQEIEFFANAEDDQLLLELYLAGDRNESEQFSLTSFAERLKSVVAELVGVASFSIHGKGVGKLVWSWGTTQLLYSTKSDSYHVRAGSFFQTNRHLTEKLLNLVTDGKSGETSLDLYAGTGLFSLPLARSFRKVIAVESAPASFADLRTNALENIESHRSATEDFLKRPMRTSPDFIVVDPPRAGLGSKVTSALTKLQSPRIAYVSCDPATLARDLHALVLGGYKIKSIDLVDLFPQTFHIETVAHLVR